MRSIESTKKSLTDIIILLPGIAFFLHNGISILVYGIWRSGFDYAYYDFREDLSWMTTLIFISSFIIAPSILAIRGYSKGEKSGFYFHLLSLMLQVLIPFSLDFDAFNPIILLPLIASLLVAILKAFDLRINAFMISLVISVSLTFASLSFGYQTPVPEISSGFLEAGFPFHYLDDATGVSVMGQIGSEDHFLFFPFLLDVLFYAIISYAGIKFMQKSNPGNKTRQETQ